jgi:hypothetical protein
MHSKSQTRLAARTDYQAASPPYLVTAIRIGRHSSLLAIHARFLVMQTFGSRDASQRHGVYHRGQETLWRKNGIIVASL